MKFALASWGVRGDIEPCTAVGRELLRRGHEVRMAVPPDQVGFVEAAGLAAVAYGLDTQAVLGAYRNFWTSFFRNFWRIQDLIRLWREVWEPVVRSREEIEHDADVVGGRGRPAIHQPEFRGGRCQRRGVLRHSVGHAASLPAAGQRPARSDPAVAVDPLRNDGVRVAELAPDEEARGRASS